MTIASAAPRVNPPFALQIELTSRCNLKCPVCPLTSGGTASSQQAGHMSELVWERLLAATDGIGHVFVAGFGEPLTDPRCVGRMQDLDALGVPSTFVTNGLALSRRRAEALVALDTIRHVNVSIDSPDPAVYQVVRGGRLSVALKGLDRLMATGVDPGRVSVSTVVGESNLDGLDAMPQLLAERGVATWVLQELIDYNDEGRDQRLSDAARTGEVLDGLRALATQHGVALVLTMPDRLDLEVTDPRSADSRYYDVEPSALSTSTPPPQAVAAPVAAPDCPTPVTRQCSVPWELPYVDKDGTVFACCFAASSNDRPLGSLSDSHLSEVWVGTEYEAFRADLLSGTAMPSSCRACTSVSLGQHPLRRFAATPVPGGTTLRRNTATLRFVNTGTATWTRDDLVRLGTAAPRDGASPLRHHSWLSADRVVSHAEDDVPVGATATFRFQVARGARPTRQELELVVDGQAWLPGTRTTLDVPAPGRLDLAARALRTRLDRAARALRRRGAGARRRVRPTVGS